MKFLAFPRLFKRLLSTASYDAPVGLYLNERGGGVIVRFCGVGSYRLGADWILSGVALRGRCVVRDVLGDLEGTGDVDRPGLRPIEALLGVVERCSFRVSAASYRLFALIPTDT